MDWHRFDADPDPTFQFDADPDPYPDPSLSFFYFSVKGDKIFNSLDSNYIEISWKKGKGLFYFWLKWIRIRQNDADPTTQEIGIGVTVLCTVKSPNFDTIFA